MAKNTSERARMEGEAGARWRAALLLAAAAGAASVLAQATWTREALVVLGGNELVIGLVLAFWYLGIVLGALLGGRWLASRAARVTPLLVAGLAALMPPGLLALRAARRLGGVEPGELLSPAGLALACCLAVVPLSAGVGALFPTLCALWPSRAARARSVDRVLAVEALASLLAGLALSIWALPALGVERSLAAGGLGLLGSAALAAWWLRQRVQSLGLLLLLALAGVASLWGAPETLGEFSRGLRFDDVGQGYRRLRELDSPYQNLVLAAPASSPRGEDSLALFENGQHALGLPDPYSVAPRLHLALLQHPRPRRALVIGGGLPGAPQEALAHGLTQLDYLDLDPAVIELLQQALPPALRAPLEDPRLRLLPVDARRHLQQTDARYDLVLVDLPDPQSAMLNRAFTREFFGELQRALAPGAAVVVRASSVDAYLGEASTSPTAATYKALCQAFAHCDVLPGTEALLLASADAEVIRVEPELLARRAAERGLRSAYFSVEELPLLVPAERQRALRQALAQAAVPPNSDARPATYFYNLILLGHQSAPWLARTLHALRGLHPAWLVAALLLPALAAAGLRRVRPAAGAPRRAALFAIASTGLLGTAESVALVYAFQNRVGVLYTWLAALVGLFMLGLAAGSLLGGRLLASPSLRPPRLLLGAELLNAALALGLGAALVVSARLEPASSAALIGAALVLGGLGVGLSFVAASACLGGPTGRVAGWVDAADCGGAALGALLTGVVGLPVLGAVGLAAVLGALKLSALLALWGSGLLRASAPPAEG